MEAFPSLLLFLQSKKRHDGAVAVYDSIIVAILSASFPGPYMPTSESMHFCALSSHARKARCTSQGKHAVEVKGTELPFLAPDVP